MPRREALKHCACCHNQKYDSPRWLQTSSSIQLPCDYTFAVTVKDHPNVCGTIIVSHGGGAAIAPYVRLHGICKVKPNIFGLHCQTKLPIEFVNWADIERRWVMMVRRGYALERLQAAITGCNIIELSKRITQTAGRRWRVALAGQVRLLCCWIGMRTHVRYELRCVVTAQGCAHTLHRPASNSRTGAA